MFKRYFVMAKLKSIFEFGGRIGNFVVYSLNGKLCMRSLPETPPPMCAEMVAQQGRMKAVAILYRAMKAAGLLEAWQRLEKPAGWSAYNLFTKQNIRVLTEEGFIGDFQHFVGKALRKNRGTFCVKYQDMFRKRMRTQRAGKFFADTNPAFGPGSAGVQKNGTAQSQRRVPGPGTVCMVILPQMIDNQKWT